MIRPYNLTRTSAEQRARLLRPSAYDITLDLTNGAGGPGGDSFRSATTVWFDCVEPGSATFIEVAADKLTEATLNGSGVDTHGWSSESGLALTGLAAANVLTVAAEFKYASASRGMNRSVDPVDGEIYLYTSFEPTSAQQVIACFDQPDLKATFTWHVRVPRGWRAVSNMPSTGQFADDTGAVMVHFATSPRMSTYITAICAGPYAEVRSGVGGRDLGIFCRPSMLDHLDTDEIFDLTRRGMEFYEKQFGQPYPLPKYDYVAAPGYLGAMENFGCIVFAEQSLIFRSTPTDGDRLNRAAIILHELAHMWFGDLVTMRWWDDLWLNEAFATWASFWSMAEATELPEPWATFAIEYTYAGIKADQLSSTHPVYANIPDVGAAKTNFDAITYRKGASALKQLAAYVGIDAFTSALRSYFVDRAWSNATFDDLVTALAAASGRPVREFAERWLRTTGVNTLRPELIVDAGGWYQKVTVVQEAPEGHPTLRTHRTGVGLYDLAGSRLVRRRRVEVELAGDRTEIASLRGVRVADVLLVNDDDLTYAKVRLDERSLAAVRSHVQGFESAVARAVCWAAAGDMVNDAELTTREFIDMVHNGLAVEEDAALVTSVLTEAIYALNYFADPVWAPTGWSRLATMCRAAAYSAQPGGSLQLAWVRAFAAVARASDDLHRLSAWYAGADLPPGLRPDADLRWLMLQGLVAFAAADADDVERAAAADRSVDGQRQAAFTRALIPSIESKQRIWRAAIDGTGLPLDVRRAMLTGYCHPAHAGVTGSHVSGYLSAVDEVSSRESEDVGRYFANVAFPMAHLSDETRSVIDAWLTTGGHPTTVVRVVMDWRDKMARALAGRARDARPHPGRRNHDPKR